MNTVEIIFPENLGAGVGVNYKREYLREIYKWGIENLEDSNNTWKLFSAAIDQCYMSHKTTSINFLIPDDANAMALKLTWG